MMREIKFKYYYHNSNGEIISRAFRLDDEIANGDHFDYISDDPIMKRFTILDRVQYTGLKDKNGVEIYEGDVVTYQMASRKIKCEVVFDDDKCCFGVRDEGYPIIYGIHSNDIVSRAEVIGNIYENPELLQEKQGDE